MKTRTMKNQSKLLIMLLSILMISFTSCNKDDDNLSDADSQTITEEEAVEAIAKAISPETGGFVEQTNEAIYLIEENEVSENSTTTSGTFEDTYECGENYATSFIRSLDNSTHSYNVNYNWDWMLNCTSDDSPLSFTFNLEGGNTYSSPRMSSVDSSDAALSITGLDDAIGEYTINQSYVREGTQTSFVRAQNSFVSTINFETSDLKILKANYNITSGTVLVQFNGEVSNGNIYSFSGEVTFNGNQTATITMGSGNTYNVAW